MVVVVALLVALGVALVVAAAGQWMGLGFASSDVTLVSLLIWALGVLAKSVLFVLHLLLRIYRMLGRGGHNR